MEDSYRHKGLRKKLIEEIKRKGIDDQRVLYAINKVPRHLFMDSGFIDFSYKDQVRIRKVNLGSLRLSVKGNHQGYLYL